MYQDSTTTISHLLYAYALSDQLPSISTPWGRADWIQVSNDKGLAVLWWLVLRSYIGGPVGVSTLNAIAKVEPTAFSGLYHVCAWEGECGRVDRRHSGIEGGVFWCGSTKVSAYQQADDLCHIADQVVKLLKKVNRVTPMYEIAEAREVFCVVEGK